MFREKIFHTTKMFDDKCLRKKPRIEIIVQ